MDARKRNINSTRVFSKHLCACRCCRRCCRALTRHILDKLPIFQLNIYEEKGYKQKTVLHSVSFIIIVYAEYAFSHTNTSHTHSIVRFQSHSRKYLQFSQCISHRIGSFLTFARHFFCIANFLLLPQCSHQSPQRIRIYATL